MTKTHLSREFGLLTCPHCQSGFAEEYLPNGNTILSCRCFSYPVVAGVVYLKKDKKALVAAKKIRNGDGFGALTALLDISKKFLLPLVFFTYPKARLPFPLVIRFFVMMGFDAGWAKYILKRKNIPTYYISLLAIKLINKGDVVADVGCGLGQTLVKISEMTKPQLVIGLDRSFLNLYLAGKYFAQNGNLLVTCDLEGGVPIHTRSLDNILVADTFHYINNKEGFLKEISRALSDKGVVSLVQNLNVNKLRDIRGIAPGKLSNNMKRLRFREVKVFPNEELWAKIIERDEISLSDKPRFDLGEPFSYSLIASKISLPQKVTLSKNEWPHSGKTNIYHGNEPELSYRTDRYRLSKSYNFFYFVSPHLDDVVLSCADLIEFLQKNGKHVVVVSVFTEGREGILTPQAKHFLEKTGFLNSGELYSRFRMEDIRAQKYLGTKYIHLGFPDAAFRRNGEKPVYKNEISQFSGAASILDNKLKASIINELNGILGTQKTDSVVFGPLGVGGHADHIITRDIICDLEVPVVLWEDYPYNHGHLSVKKIIGRNASYKEIFRINQNMVGAKKLRAIKKYKSQMKLLFPGGKVVLKDEVYYLRQGNLPKIFS